MSINEHLWEFPHTMTLKVIGTEQQALTELVADVLRRHLGTFDVQSQLSCTASSKGNFISLNARIVMQNAEQVSAIYQELKSSEHTRVVL